MYTNAPPFTARVARKSRRAIGAVHAADVSPRDAVTRCGVRLPRARAVILPDEEPVSCLRCERGMASPVTCYVVPFPGVNLADIEARRARHAELWRLARKAYRFVRKIRAARKG